MRYLVLYFMVPLFTVRVKVLRLLIGIHCYLAISNHALTPTPNKKVIIVGGGVGGLSIAARIAPLAREVHIFEKNARIGGRCGSFHVSVPYINGTFRHEYGPSLLLLPHVYEQLFTDCGTTAQACGLEMKQCVPAYQCVFDDGDCILVGYPDDATTSSSSGKNRFRKEILESRQKMDSFEPGGAKRWDEYMAACQAYLDCGLPNFIEQRLDLASFPAFLRQALGGFGKAWPLKPHSDVLDAIFQSDKMKAMASFQDLYVGLEPFRNDQQIFGGITDTTAPAVFGLLSAIELHPSNSKCGVFAPVGGFRAVTMAMEKLARELGVHIHCNTTVTKVTDNGVYFCDKIDESGRTNEFAEADLVIVNADLPYAASCLIQDDLDPTIPHFDWTNKRNSADLRFSSGVIAFHWSLDKELVDLNTHNVFLASGSREGAVQSWQALRDNQDDFSDGAPFNFYVHRASMTDATAAPLGCDSLLVLVPCKTLERQVELRALERKDAIDKYTQQIDSQLVKRVKDVVLERLAVIPSLSNLRNHIVHEVVDTPATYADSYNLAAGTPFGLNHGLAQLSFMRPGPSSSGLPNVIYVGASSRPGNGVPLVLIGARMASSLVIDKLQNDP